MIVGDDLTVEIAPGADLGAASSTWSWVDITTRVRHADGVDITGMGRGDESADADTPSLTIRVENEGGDFSSRNPLGQWYPDLGVGTPIRVYWDTTDNIRFAGHISELPPRWVGDEAGSDEVAIIRADGITRRLEQGAPALNSALFRSLSTDSKVVAYWPCEDGSDSDAAASPIMGVQPWSMPADFASVDGPPGSDRLLQVTTDTASTLARVPNHTPGATYHVQVAYQIEDESGTRSLLVVHTTSADVALWHLHITDTTFRVQARDGDGALVVNDTTTLDHSLFGQWIRVELRLSDVGGTSIAWTARIFAVDVAQTQLNELTGSEGGALGRITRVGVGDGGNWQQDRYFGHLAVLTGASADLVSSDLHKPFHGYTTELAADRFERVCDEEGLSCSIVAPTGGLRVPGESTAHASTPDAAAHDITGDIDVQAWVAPDEWASGALSGIASKWDDSGDERSWRLVLLSAGGVRFQWTTDGTTGTLSTVQANLAPLPDDAAPAAVRATLDVDDGSSQHVVTLYVAPSLDGPWTEFHSETLSGTTSIHSGTADLRAANVDAGFVGVIRELRVYDGIAGTLVADPDFTQQTIGATSFDDDAGNTWTVNGNAAIVRADDSMPMGPQQIDTLIANLQDIETADAGILSEADFGFVYRTRTSLHNQDDALTLSQPDGELAHPPEPTDDDRNARNDVTAERPSGTSVRAVDDDHITDHGSYAESVEISTATDDQLQQSAYWRLHLGTVDEYRWPRIDIALHADEDLIDDWLAVQIGDRITIDHDISQLDGVDIDLIVVGWSERFDQFNWDATLNCVPASPFTVLELEHDTNGRIDTSGAETSGSFDAGTDTSLTVVTTAERPWINSTDHAAQFPFHIRISGVVLNVTAITGSSSPQTFTVDAAPVNGVEKTIASGSAVNIHPIPVLAL